MSQICWQSTAELRQTDLVTKPSHSAGRGEGHTWQDNAVRVWRSSPGRAAFDLQAPKKLTQHTGPVSSVALSAANIFSGSWDYSVRVWSRATLRQLALLSFPDWVDCLAPRWARTLTTAVGILGSSMIILLAHATAS